MQSPGLLLTFVAFVLMLGPLVFFHELGHYFAARWFGIKADVFSIGFGREITGWTDKRGTRWKLSVLPLGGYVRFAGDMDATSQADPGWVALPPEERARTFQGRPVGQRAIVSLAGPMANFIIAFLILLGLALAYGENRTPAVAGAIAPNSAAASIGLQPGDRITALNGRPMTTFEDLLYYVQIRANAPVHVDYERGGKALAADTTIRKFTETDQFGNVIERGFLGIAPGRPDFARVNLLEAPGVAFRDMGNILRLTAEGFGQLISGQRSVKEMSGVVGMGRVSGEQLSLGFAPFIYLVAFISINLGFMNLLPVPMLDGGHLLFNAIEAVRRRPVTARVQEWAFRGGLAVILALFVVVTFNDLDRVGVWKHLAGLIG